MFAVLNFRDQREVLERHCRLVDSLKHEIVRLQRQLINSQHKRTVLEDEVIRREKVHRWTTLKVNKALNIKHVIKTRIIKRFNLVQIAMF